MKRQKSTHVTEIEHQLPSGVTVSFREDSSVNPSTFIIFKAADAASQAAAEGKLTAFFNSLLAEVR